MFYENTLVFLFYSHIANERMRNSLTFCWEKEVCMSYKISCNSTTCIYNKGSACVHNNIIIGSNGKCESLTKGLLYYFRIVWDALGSDNFIDFNGVNTSEDLRIGIYFVCKTFRVGLFVMEMGTSKRLQFKKEKDGDALKYEDILKQDADLDAFRGIQEDMRNGLYLRIDNRLERQPAGTMEGNVIINDVMQSE